MAAAEARFSIFKLPPELRNRIYELVLGPPKHICVQRTDIFYTANDGDTYYAGYGNCYSEYQRPPPITQVSRQIRAETTPIHYGQHTFVAYVDSDPFRWPDTPDEWTQWRSDRQYKKWTRGDPTTGGVRDWLDRIGSHQASLIKHFLIRIPLPEPTCTWKRQASCSKADCDEWHPSSSAQVSKYLGIQALGVKDQAVKASFGATCGGIEWKDSSLAHAPLDWSPVGNETLANNEKFASEDVWRYDHWRAW